MKRFAPIVVVMMAALLSGCAGIVSFETSRRSYKLAGGEISSPMSFFSPRLPVVVNFTLENGKDAYIRCEVRVRSDSGREKWIPVLAGTGATCSVRALRSGYYGGYGGSNYVVSAKVYAVPALFDFPQRKGQVYAEDSLQAVYEGITSEVYRYGHNHHRATQEGIVLSSYTVEAPRPIN